MKTAKEREAEFREELSALLKKHNAELETGCLGCSDIVVFMWSQHDEDRNVIAEYTDFRIKC